jgi:hypothetical protein
MLVSFGEDICKKEGWNRMEVILMDVWGGYGLQEFFINDKYLVEIGMKIR